MRCRGCIHWGLLTIILGRGYPSVLALPLSASSQHLTAVTAFTLDNHQCCSTIDPSPVQSSFNNIGSDIELKFKNIYLSIYRSYLNRNIPAWMSTASHYKFDESVVH